MYSTLKQRGNVHFHVVLTWNTCGVFVGFLLTEDYSSLKFAQQITFRGLVAYKSIAYKRFTISVLYKFYLLCHLVLFSYRQTVISKHLRLDLTLVSIINNPKCIATFLNIKLLIWKFQILIHINGFRIGILF